MARKTYSEEFRRDAVEVYRSTPGATVVGIAGDLGIMDSTLSTWLQVARVPVRPSGSRAPTVRPPGGETTDQELSRLRSRVRELKDESPAASGSRHRRSRSSTPSPIHVWSRRSTRP